MSGNRFLNRIISLFAVFLILLISQGCNQNREETPSGDSVPKNGEIYVLFTSDVHCGIEKGFGYAGLKEIRDSLEMQGYETILVDDGDAIQGDTVGTLSKGDIIIDLMNALEYDIAIPGNHEFDYGVDRFLELTKKAHFQYISCNFRYMGEPVFKPYVIKECAGIKIAFVGVTTPSTVFSSTPSFFQDENGEYIYDFMQDMTGESVYEAVQEAVDSARSEGADLVYLISHLGMNGEDSPWTYAEIIENTNGIDVLLDGHSHDTSQIKMKNKDGETVTRSACGTKLNCIGYSLISSEKEVYDTGIWSWPNKISAPELLNIQNGVSDIIKNAKNELRELLDRKIANSNVTLTINDPVLKDSSGNPVRMVRRAETNLGDLCADAFRIEGNAEIALVNGGGIRSNIEKGIITYEDIINLMPFGNNLCVIKVSGQQILDALEWGSRNVPDELGGFIQVSGLSYEIDVGILSGCISDENGMMIGIDGERRVKNVFVGDAPIDPEKNYTVAGIDYMLLSHGDGYTAFDGAEIISDSVKIDHQALIDYIVDVLGGEIGEDYDDPYGRGSIVITGS